MRIRLRVPSDGEPKQTGLFGWVRGLFYTPEAEAPVPTPPPAPDKRWQQRGNASYATAGRLCVQQDGTWMSAYIFDVTADGKPQQIRVILSEADVEVWEKANTLRMPEAVRLRLVRETLHALIDLDRLPSAIHVNPLEIENAKL